MASGIGGYATGSRLGNIPRKIADRAKTVVGDDVRAVKRAAKNEVREDRYTYRQLTGKDMATGRPKARKPASSRSGR